jgi:hypothetical protein
MRESDFKSQQEYKGYQLCMSLGERERLK